jgi:DNA-binding CsgD family transcriptional regulator
MHQPTSFKGAHLELQARADGVDMPCSWAAWADHIPAALWWVDAHMRVLHANLAADQAAREHGWATVRGHTLVRVGDLSGTALHTLPATPSGTPGQHFGTRDHGDTAWRLWLTLRPWVDASLLSDAIAGHSAAAPVRLLTVTAWPAQHEQHAWSDRARLNHSLTRTQTQVLRDLGMGRSVQDIAQARGTSVTTVRTHIQQLLAKSGAKGQNGLIRLSWGLVADADLV